MSVIYGIWLVVLVLALTWGCHFTWLSLERLRARVRLLENRIAAVEDRQHREWDR